VQHAAIRFSLVACLTIACSASEQSDFVQYFEAIRSSDLPTRYGVERFAPSRDNRYRLRLTGGETVLLHLQDEEYRIVSIEGGVLTDALTERTDSIVANVRRFDIVAIGSGTGSGYHVIFDLKNINPTTLPKAPVVDPPAGEERVAVGVLLYAPSGVANRPSATERSSVRIADGWYYNQATVLRQFVR
jgi:hypothetical protein